MSSSIPKSTRAFTLAKYITGKPDNSAFKVEEKPLPELKDGDLLLKLEYLSVDPYLRPKMSDKKGAAPAEAFSLGETIKSSCVSRVLQSKSPKFKEGDFVGYIGDWAEFSVRSADHVRPLLEGVDPEAALSVVGLNGLTAYFGLLFVGKLKEKDTVLITAAAGATGYLAGSIAKMQGCRVVGLTGSDGKCKVLKDLGFDACLNYKTSKNLCEDIAKICPQGIDVFFDNVGGCVADAVRPNMNIYGHLVQCGAISSYCEEAETGPRVEGVVLAKRLRWKGFILHDYKEHFNNALHQLAQWYRDKKIPKRATVIEGFDNAPKAFAGLFTGENVGKMLVHV